MSKRILLMLLILVVFASADAQVVSTFAGTAGLSGTTNGTGTAARFNNPHGITADKAGNVYVADRYNNIIRKISPSGVVTTLAGSGAVGSTDGPGISATFNEPWGITCDTLGNLYVADTKNYKIRQIDAAGNVTTVAGVGVFGTTNGPNNVARFGFSSGIAVTKDGSIIYVADYNTHVIRKIFNGQTNTFAGTIFIAGNQDGTGTAATFNHPYGIELDVNDNIIVADEWSNRIRKVTPLAQVTTFAGQGVAGSADGSGLSAQFNYPWDITVDALNNVYVMDGLNFTIRRIANGSNTVSTYAGTAGVSGSNDGTGPAARFNNAAGICFNPFDKCLYVADCNNHTIRKVTSISSITIALAVTGSSTICFGDSIHLTANPSGLSNYQVSEGTTVLGSSSNGNFVLAPLPAGSHTFTCTALDANGATANSNSVSVTVLSAFVPTFTSSKGTSFCTGDSTLLSAQTGSSYLWSTAATTQNIYVKTAGTYSVTVTNSNGCKGTSTSMSVTLQSVPIAAITSSSNTVCPNDSVTLTASAGTSWNWSNGSTTQIIKVPSGSYTVTVSNGGCSAISPSTTITNYAVSLPVINPAGPITIISGDSIQLTATNGSNFQWTGGGTGNSIYVTAAGYYSVTGTSTNGCAVTSSPVQVIVITAQSMISAGGATSFCEGNSVMLNSLFSTGNQWYYNGILINGETNQQYLATDSGYYKVAVFINGNWMYSDSILVNVASAPQPAVVSDTSVCSGNSVYLEVPILSGESYKWYNQQSGGSVLSNMPFYQTSAIANSTTYYVETTGANGCTSTACASINIAALPTPVVDFNYTSVTQNGQYVTTFTNKTGNADSYLWIFGDTAIAGNSSTKSDPVYSYTTPGTYSVTLIATNANGCTNILSRVITIQGNNALFIPTTFTPNNDGRNDIFRVRGDHFSIEEMLIYDQWGTVVYRGDESRPEWDGKTNGNTVQNGTYVYRIRLIDKDNISQELTGSITVIK